MNNSSLNTFLFSVLILLSSVSCSKKPAPAVSKEAVNGNFQNPGGMWLPDQVAAQGETLASLGVEIEAKEFADLLGYPMGAIIQIPGCSASFVSQDGLLITNHHCARPAINRNNSKYPIRDKGYLAKNRNEELPYGPTGRVYINQKFEDVTQLVFKGTTQVNSPQARYDLVDKNVKALTKECENTPNTRCQVVSFFHGEKFVRFYQLELRDLRLVYVPPFSVGFYGGDIDNWRWPRETGDFAFFRAYVGKDGLPASPSPDNVAYRPKQYLKLPSKPLNAGDFAMVAGFPGVTNRYTPLEELADAASLIYPDTIKRYQDYIAIIDGVIKANGGPNSETANRAGDRLMGLNNYLINYQATVDGFAKQNVLAQKVKERADLQAWIRGDASRQAKYGEVLQRISKLYAAKRAFRAKDGALLEMLAQGTQIPPISSSFAGPGGTLVSTALLLVRNAQERKKPDALRAPGYQERDYPALKSRLLDFSKVYDKNIDYALMKKAFERALNTYKVDTFLEGPLGKAGITMEYID